MTGPVPAHHRYFTRHLTSCGALDDDALPALSDDVVVSSIVIHDEIAVQQKGLQYVMLEVCYWEQRFQTSLHGTIAFRNPYGYLRAIFFGFLPFEGARSVMMILFNLGFLVLLMQHRDKLLPLHYAILGVSLVAAAEATTWCVLVEGGGGSLWTSGSVWSAWRGRRRRLAAASV